MIRDLIFIVFYEVFSLINYFDCKEYRNYDKNEVLGYLKWLSAVEYKMRWCRKGDSDISIIIVLLIVLEVILE